MTMMKEYQIYKFRRPGEDDIVTEFFLPDKSVWDVLARNNTLARYRKDGFICVGFVCVDKETYLNARLDQTVQDYCSNEMFRHETFRKYIHSSLSDEVFFETMQLVDEFKWTCLRKLDKQVRRLMREGLDIYNETAIQLYDGLHGHNSVSV